MKKFNKNTFVAKIKNIFDCGLNLLFPKNIKCVFCGQDVENFDKKPYCAQCEKENYFNNDKYRCRFCDVPTHSESYVCEFCKNNHPVYQKAFCPLLYKGDVKNAILRFKDDNAKYLAKTFAKFIVERLNKQNITVDVIIPVPSHPKTIRLRGYNQAEILANEISNLLTVPVENNLITKTSQTKEQKELNFKQRQQNLYNSFKTSNLTKLKGKNVLIVDDIMTTGATVNAISRLIKKYANNIYVACIARRDIEDSKQKT